jgi:hypothetical protein
MSNVQYIFAYIAVNMASILINVIILLLKWSNFIIFFNVSQPLDEFEKVSSDWETGK